MEKISLPYLNVGSAKSYAFYQIPKELINNEAFDDIDYGSKILYSLMLNRASLSAHNPEFIDAVGNVYIIYSVEQVMTDLRCSNKTAIKMMAQLENIGLIEKKRQGQGKPSLIYVKDFSFVHFQKCKKYTSGSVKNTLPEVKKIHSSYTNRKKTDNSKTDNSISIVPKSQKKNNIEKKQPIGNDSILTIKKGVSETISLELLQSKYPERQDDINELYELIVEALISKKKTHRIAKEDLPADIVKDAFMKLNIEHIEYVLDSLKNNTTEVKNIKAYLLTALYNATKTMDNHNHLKEQRRGVESNSSFDIYEFYKKSVERGMSSE